MRILRDAPGCGEGVGVWPAVPSDRTGLLLSRPLRTVRESFQLTQLKPSERLVTRRGDDGSFAEFRALPDQ